MKPAVCFLCGKSAIEEPQDNKGDWLKFADYQQDSSTSLTHPEGLEYVCNEHLSAAKLLINKSSKEALLELQQKYGKFDKAIYQGPMSNKQTWWQRIISKLGL